jgi:hypothetical protein
LDSDTLSGVHCIESLLASAIRFGLVLFSPSRTLTNGDFCSGPPLNALSSYPQPQLLHLLRELVKSLRRRIGTKQRSSGLKSWGRMYPQDGSTKTHPRPSLRRVSSVSPSIRSEPVKSLTVSCVGTLPIQQKVGQVGSHGPQSALRKFPSPVPGTSWLIIDIIDRSLG